jgi:drug/metabolite transporter (DMT)-like permease
MVGTLLFFLALKRIGAFQSSLLLKSEPVLTSLMSWLILGETLSFS